MPSQAQDAQDILIFESQYKSITGTVQDAQDVLIIEQQYKSATGTIHVAQDVLIFELPILQQFNYSFPTFIGF